MSGGVLFAPGSFAWLARHELFLAWRNRPQRGALRWLGVVFIVAWAAFGCWIGWLLRDVPIPLYPPALVGVLVASILIFTFMTTQAMIGSQQTLYESGDLALLFTAPLEPRSVLLAKLLGIAGAIVMTYALLLLPFVLPVAVLGHPQLFGLVALLFALALAAAAAGLAITMLIVRIAGPRAARTVGKIVAALLGGSFFLVSQIMSHVDRGTRGPNAFTTLFHRLRESGFGSEGWSALPGRAAFGDPLAALFMLGLGIALFALAGASLQRRFLTGYQDGGAKLSRSTAQGKPMARLFHAGLTRSIFAKEWRLLARDPALAFQLVLRLVYMAPILYLAFGKGRHLALAPTLAFASVLVAVQLVGSLSWLTVSAEDSPDLIAVAPVIKDDIDTAKLLAAFAMAAPFALALPIAIAFHTISGALATLVMSAIGGGLSGIVELNFGKPGQRAAFAKRRRSGSFVSGILNLIISFAFGSVAGVLVYFLS
jgi:ABC-2 type transport system permease protein